MYALTNADAEKSPRWQHDDVDNEMATKNMLFILKRRYYCGITIVLDTLADVMEGFFYF